MSMLPTVSSGVMVLLHFAIICVPCSHSGRPCIGTASQLFVRLTVTGVNCPFVAGNLVVIAALCSPYRASTYVQGTLCN
jgi:hypothetical protein